MLRATTASTTGVTWSSLVSSGASVTKGVNTGDSNTVANTTTETTFTQSNVTYTLNANEADNLTVIKIAGYGKFGTKTGTTGTLTIRLKKDGVTLCTVVANPGSGIVNSGFVINGQIQFRTFGVSGTATAALFLVLDGAGSSAQTSYVNVTAAPVSWDTTVNSTVQYSAQWSTANAANTITIQMIDFTIIK